MSRVEEDVIKEDIPTPEHAEAVCAVGLQMCRNLSQGVYLEYSADGIESQVYPKGAREESTGLPIDFVYGGERLGPLGEAVRSHVNRVCTAAGVAIPHFAKYLPGRFIPREDRYVGDLINAVASVMQGEEERKEFTRSPVVGKHTFSENQQAKNVRSLLGITDVMPSRIVSTAAGLEIGMPTKWDNVELVTRIYPNRISAMSIARSKK